MIKKVAGTNKHISGFYYLLRGSKPQWSNQKWLTTTKSTVPFWNHFGTLGKYNLTVIE